MFGAIYTGLTGLNAYSRGLQQVSNNVTNLNTSGFKGSTVSFQSYYATSDRGGLSYSSSGGGGGGGVGISDPRLDLSRGELRQTDRDLDLAIDGTGFLVLLDGTDVVYARTGSFEVDESGFIVLAGTDYRLATLDAAGRPVSLSIDSARTSAPKPTSRIAFADNLSSSDDEYSVADLRVHDARGGEHVWTAKFVRDKDAAGNAWTVSVTDATGATMKSAAATLRFDLLGKVDPETAALSFTDEAAGFTVALDFPKSVTSFSAGDLSTLRSASVDGHGVGAVTSIAVNAAGELELGYSNEQKLALGAIAIADFRDPQALEQRSGGLFAFEGTNGLEYLGSADPRVGKVLSRRLEASNVDLAKQFGDLILIQRGFQASSQIVSVSNDMIQQLFGIRGQQ
ncbi:MAG: flagellar hook-basal body complex protein [Sphingomonas sp.]